MNFKLIALSGGLGRALVMLALLSLPTLLPAQFTFTTNNGSITLTRYIGPGGEVSIPATINDLAVTCIGNGAFRQADIVTRIMIGRNVSRIGVYAFYSCASVTAIAVDENNASYTSLDGVLFDRSRSVVIQYPAGREGSYTIPDGVSEIGTNAFRSCTGLTEIIIPESITRIGESAFRSCASLSHIIIPHNVTDIENHAFAGSSLTTIKIPNSVTNLGDTAFYECFDLMSVEIGSSIRRVGQYVFASCHTLTNVALPSNVDTIDDWAFYNCPSLASVTIPQSATNLGDHSFYYCIKLTDVYFKGNAPILNGSSVFAGDDYATVHYLPGTIGWGALFGGCPTSLWFLPNPLILNNSPSFGVTTNRFGFMISWATNVPVVVEACANAANPLWFPVSTNTLTDGWSYFGDAQWTNYPARFYRIRSP